MSPLRKVFGFIFSATHSRTIGILIFFVLLVAVSLTVYVAQQQQQLRQRASGLTVCNTVDSIPACSSNNPANNTCSPEGDKCKIGNTIYECMNAKDNNEFN